MNTKQRQPFFCKGTSLCPRYVCLTARYRNLFRTYIHYQNNSGKSSYLSARHTKYQNILIFSALLFARSRVTLRNPSDLIKYRKTQTRAPQNPILTNKSQSNKTERSIKLQMYTDKSAERQTEFIYSNKNIQSNKFRLILFVISYNQSILGRSQIANTVNK